MVYICPICAVFLGANLFREYGSGQGYVQSSGRQVYLVMDISTIIIILLTHSTQRDNPCLLLQIVA